MSTTIARSPQPRDIMHRLFRRTSARLLVLALLCTVGWSASTGPAVASTLVRECKATNISCVSYSGYLGKPVWGYPVNSSGNNCVNYVAFRLAKNGVAQQSTMGNGGSWATNAARRGFRVDQRAAPGAVAQWALGSAYAPSMGHVGYVEEVTASYIVISDSSWGGGYSSRWRVAKGDRNWPTNFIHFKDQPYQPPVSGSFLRVRETAALYRLVGRTPVRVRSTSGLGTVAPLAVSATSLATLPKTVAEGLFVQGSVRGDVFRVTGGAPLHVRSWSSVGGVKPVVRVEQRIIDLAGGGGDYAVLRRVPVDGQALRELASGRTYVVRAGKALRITDWAQVGGYRRPSPVDPASIRYAGRPPQYLHLTGLGVFTTP